MIKWQLNDHFSITSNTTFDSSVDHHQIVTIKKDQSGATKYLVGTVDRNTISSTLRFEYFISPEISLQYYGNPYASIGTYDKFREVADASNRLLDKQYTSLSQSKFANNYYQLKKNNEQSYTIKNPDFNYQVLIQIWLVVGSSVRDLPCIWFGRIPDIANPINWTPRSGGVLAI